MSAFELGELRYIAQVTQTVNFTGLDDATWAAATATKLRKYDFEQNLTEDTVPDGTMQTRTHGRPAMIKTIKGGSIKFKMHLEGGTNSAGTPPTVATLLSKILGGIKDPPSTTDAVEALSTPSNIVATAHGNVAGQSALHGVRGDGRAEAKVGVIGTANTNDYDLLLALPGTPTAGDAIAYAHTVYLDEDADLYCDFAIIGDFAGTGVTDGPNQYNLIGCQGTAALGGINEGETPFIEFEFFPTDWRLEPDGTKASLSHTTPLQGDGPVVDNGIGALVMGDYGSYTRTQVPGGDLEVAINTQGSFRKDLNGPNMRGAWKRLPHETGPTFAVTRYWDDMPGLLDDFPSTGKQIMLQMGFQAGNCAAVELPRTFIDELPNNIELEAEDSVKLAMHGEDPGHTLRATDDQKLQDSAIRFHFYNS